MKRIFLVLFLAMALLIPHLNALQKVIKPPTTLQNQKLTPVRQTDLRMDVIHSSRCICDLPGLDAFYMSNIMVDFSNHKIGKMGANTKAIIDVIYYDRILGKKIVVRRKVDLIRPYPTNPWTYQRFVMVSKPVLVKKSFGIKATIMIDTPNIKDPKPANNSKKIYKCQVMVY
jgi:hypothetical protein